MVTVCMYHAAWLLCSRKLSPPTAYGRGWVACKTTWQLYVDILQGEAVPVRTGNSLQAFQMVHIQVNLSCGQVNRTFIDLTTSKETSTHSGVTEAILIFVMRHISRTTMTT